MEENGGSDIFRQVDNYGIMCGGLYVLRCFWKAQSGRYKRNNYDGSCVLLYEEGR